jgi:mannose-6-phosphate isomerase-like protein (cupin superfamily)
VRLVGVMNPTSRLNAPHYTWAGSCDGWRLAQAKDLSVISERMSPGTTEVAHHHRVARQFFYVLAGELWMEVDGRNIAIPAGSGLEIPPGTRHRAHNAGAGPADFLVCSSPSTQGDRFEGP